MSSSCSKKREANCLSSKASIWSSFSAACGHLLHDVWVVAPLSLAGSAWLLSFFFFFQVQPENHSSFLQSIFSQHSSNYFIMWNGMPFTFNVFSLWQTEVHITVTTVWYEEGESGCAGALHRRGDLTISEIHPLYLGPMWGSWNLYYLFVDVQQPMRSIPCLYTSHLKEHLKKHSLTVQGESWQYSWVVKALHDKKNLQQRGGSLSTYFKL